MSVFWNEINVDKIMARTCITSGECLSRGGTSQGSCAAGFGVCCVCKLLCSLKMPSLYEKKG